MSIDSGSNSNASYRAWKCVGCAGAMFLLWELSTPFVYTRWFLHKAGMSGTTAYKVNGALMVVVFFLCRNVAGLGK